MRIRAGIIVTAAAAASLFVSRPIALADPTTRPADPSTPPPHQHPAGGRDGHRPMMHDGHGPPGRWSPGGGPHRGGEAAQVGPAAAGTDDEKAIEALTKQVRELTAAVKALRQTIAGQTHDEHDDRRHGPRSDRDDDGPRPDHRDDGHADGRDDRHSHDEDDRGGGRPHFTPRHHDFDHLTWRNDWRDRA